VHAAVEAREVADIGGDASRGLANGLMRRTSMFGVRIERCDPLVEPLGVRVVEQQAHAHAALAACQALGEQPAGRVRMPDVVLQSRLRSAARAAARARKCTRGFPASNAGLAGMGARAAQRAERVRPCRSGTRFGALDVAGRLAHPRREQ
jgi:hypothetical protein